RPTLLPCTMTEADRRFSQQATLRWPAVTWHISSHDGEMDSGRRSAAGLPAVRLPTFLHWLVLMMEPDQRSMQEGLSPLRAVCRSTTSRNGRPASGPMWAEA